MDNFPNENEETVNKKVTYHHHYQNHPLNEESKKMISYEELIDLISENEMLRKENRELKERIEKGDLGQSSLNKTKIRNSASLGRKSDLKVKDLSFNFENDYDFSKNSHTENFNFVQSFKTCTDTSEKIKNMILMGEFCKIKST